MATPPVTPKDLAQTLECEIDDILLMLWDAGVEYPKGPLSVIRPQDRARALAACGIASGKTRSNVAYWHKVLSMTADEFAKYASTLGIHIGHHARRLPKGALAKLDRAHGVQVREAIAPPADKMPEPGPRFVWQERGHQRDEMQFLSTEDIEHVHWAIAEDFAGSPDPISPAGVRDPALLESAANRPQTGVGDVLKYPTVEMAAAALMHSIVHNHAFYNGNKRTALVSMLCFLDLNGLVLRTNQDVLFRWTVRVASHGLNKRRLQGDRADIEVLEMTKWIIDNSRSIDQTQRIVTAAMLIRRLEELGCEVQRVGTKVSVSRTVDDGTRVWLRNRTTLKYSYPYMGEGRQVAASHVRGLRRALRLTEEYGVDSAAFFGADKSPTDRFIGIYRKTLSRLAAV